MCPLFLALHTFSTLQSVTRYTNTNKHIRRHWAIKDTGAHTCEWLWLGRLWVHKHKMPHDKHLNLGFTEFMRIEWMYGCGRSHFAGGVRGARTITANSKTFRAIRPMTVAEYTRKTLCIFIYLCEFARLNWAQKFGKSTRTQQPMHRAQTQKIKGKLWALWHLWTLRSACGNRPMEIACIQLAFITSKQLEHPNCWIRVHKFILIEWTFQWHSAYCKRYINWRRQFTGWVVTQLIARKQRHSTQKRYLYFVYYSFDFWRRTKAFARHFTSGARVRHHLHMFAFVIRTRKTHCSM